MKILESGIDNLHFYGNKYSKFCEEFTAIATDTKAISTKKELKEQLKKQLIACSKLCSIEVRQDQICRNATDLLLGIEEKRYEKILKKENFAGITLLMSNNIWTATLAF